eukprot:7112472-Pyramimonas_sp.AAC.1
MISEQTGVPSPQREVVHDTTVVEARVSSGSPPEDAVTFISVDGSVTEPSGVECPEHYFQRRHPGKRGI